MYVLNIWHTVPDHAEWKQLFDRDPLGREASGVRRYSVERSVDDEHLVTGHLEFEGLDEARAFAGRLEEIWKGQGTGLVSSTGHTITEVMEQRQFVREATRRAA